MRRLDALRKAVGELAGPLGASTGTTLAAFAPLLMAKGGAADFTRGGVPVMIMLTLSVSYLLAISAVPPLLAARFLKPPGKIFTKTGLSAWPATSVAWCIGTRAG